MTHITPPLRVLGQGFRLVSRETFLNGLVEIACYAGATSMDSAAIEQAHAEQLAFAQQRVEPLPGSYVIYNPEEDGEGWLLVGDDPAALYAETERMLADMES